MEQNFAQKVRNHLKLKQPCSNCPFLKKGAINLSDGRLKEIIDHSMSNDTSPFPCHKTVHSKTGGEWTEEGDYIPSHNEAMCAGAAAYLLKHNNSTVLMRVGFAMGIVKITDWDKIKSIIID